MATVETNTVTLTINGREITVPKGRSLVEAAAEAGIEIPVFCYEPRLGAGVGACRMCLCEIEGMPKLQTACTTPVADGMVVNSHSDRASEGQDAVLEFLLMNHPLDCPVCDKGGECPLQDLTFRYGPGVTRMTLPKRTHDKPVPVSPLIKLDRERCILCYRCTRFSESVSGDLQLVTENRGAALDDHHLRGPAVHDEFSGNVTELCPVGALTSTTYRFRGAAVGDPERPHHLHRLRRSAATSPPRSARARWCGCCRATTPRSTRAGCATAAATRSVTCAPTSRITSALIRGGRGLEAVSGADALDHIVRAAAHDRREVRRGLDRRARIGNPDQRGGPPVGADPGRGARRRHQRVRAATATPGSDALAAVPGVDRRSGRRRRDRRGRRHRAGPARAGDRAAHPQGRHRGRHG